MRQLFFSLAVLSLTIAKPVPEERSKIGTEPVHSLQDYGAVSDIITSDIGPVNQLNQAQTIGVAPDSQSQLLASDETNEAASSETDLEANEQCNAKDGLSKRGSGTPSNACSVTKTPQKVTLPVTGTQGGKQWRQNPNIDPSNPQAGERPIHLFSGTNWCPEKHPWILCSKDIPYENNPGAVPVMWRPQIFNCLFYDILLVSSGICHKFNTYCCAEHLWVNVYDAWLEPKPVMQGINCYWAGAKG